MSKKQIYGKHIEKGRFYIHSDITGGHPALVYKKNDKKNRYYVLIFSSSSGPKRKQLIQSIEPEKINKSFVHNMPKIVKRRELGSKELKGIRISKVDKPLIELIKRKKWFIRPIAISTYESLCALI